MDAECLRVSAYEFGNISVFHPGRRETDSRCLFVHIVNAVEGQNVRMGKLPP